MPEDLEPATRLTPELPAAPEPAAAGALLPEVAALLPQIGLLAPAVIVPEPVLDGRNAPVAGVVRWTGSAHGFTATAITDDDVQVYVRPVDTDTETGVELVDGAGNVVGSALTHNDPTIDVSGCYVEPDAEAADE
ncbi:hypothetical protein VA596_49970 [Amycolatopsis sp., V23-08]|uniref:Uncharacterized protein n=1 Tax=Amycolatopsis heterodermiae TaxID=3110235 RepID=A0ABU5RPC2_9PSEU|nr:hypothetical protein [Amycolatopsis sp., V23-08]MEA5367739.1 hypothetical protein [Amycolatopsis sp., V23-08]